ncbi:hypothetical protein KAR91_16000 [Candidatus Pacearchaeota archaeon]|nr:hypothetical protein [Candidatus Pacearchaeota archaeon]
MNYIRKNQVGQDCQIVTAINASICLNDKLLVDPKSEKYKQLLKLTGCVSGSATCIEKAFPVLLIKEKIEYKTWFDIDFNDLPLEIKVWRLPYGFHSICVIDYIEQCDALRVLNFDYETTVDGWIFKENLYHFITNVGSSWVARSFEQL